MSVSLEGPGCGPGTSLQAVTERHLAAGTPVDDFRAAFDGAQLAMAVVGGDGLVRAANSRMLELVGAGEGGLAGASAAELTGLRDEPWSWAGFVDVLQGRRASLRCTRRMKDSGGRSLSVEMTLTPLSGGRALLSLTDVTEQRELRAKLRHLKMHDPVTRLPNRELFFERLTGALQEARQAEEPGAEHGGAGRDAGQGGGPRTRAGARGTPGRVGLAYLDLDGFKAVNDTLGHRVGDRLLAAVARRLVACTAEAGRAEKHGITVARLGGDEFAVLVARSAGTEQLGELAQQLLDALVEPFDLAGQRLAVSASIGVVERAASGQTATALMQAADTTLYWAKADGKARWTLFDPERNAHRMTRQALSSTLRPAIERDEFTLDYQPLIDLGDGSVRGVEALVRWQHPKLGTLTPNRFIGLAEENGAIVPLGRWVLATACRRAAGWRRLRPADPVFVSVNVAVRQVWDSDLVADVGEILDETGLPPRLLQLELTESAVMGSAGRPLQALQELSEMGVGIAIDDFGTGYSNLAYLSRLPVSALKLDGSFVRGFSSAEHPSPADETIVEALVGLAHRLGISVTAECVESGEQAERLRRIGCDTAQGWFYSRAVPAERVERLL